jgi:MreB/Mrl family cell shape determining protein
MFRKKIGIDLGTANTVVFVPGRGFIINEPTIVALTRPENTVLAVGAEAKEMIGRTPDEIIAYRPLKDGVIADYYITKAMLQYFISKASGWFNLFHPDVVISVPAGITQTERRAVVNAAREAGAGNAFIVREPILAALGAGIPINARSGNMIVNIGGGTSEQAVIALGNIVSWASLRVAGNKFDQAIMDYIKKKYALAIGEQTAEHVKIEIGASHEGKDGISRARPRSRDGVAKGYRDKLERDRRSIESASYRYRRIRAERFQRDAAGARRGHHGKGYYPFRWQRPAPPHAGIFGTLSGRPGVCRRRPALLCSERYWPYFEPSRYVQADIAQ